jgi:vacuolar-type H+-ATPase subunit C/Vma6
VAELLLTWRSPHAAPLLEALRVYHEPRDLYLLELGLDRSYFLKSGRLPSDQPSMEALRTFLGVLADKTNLMTALKISEERLILTERERYFLPGGTGLSYPVFVMIQSAGGTGGLAGALAQARSTRFGSVLAEIGEPPPGIGMLALVEGRLERAVIRTAHRIHRADPLGLGAVLAFLWDKIHELMNLRLILRGRMVNLPDQALRALLTTEV